MDAMLSSELTGDSSEEELRLSNFISCLLLRKDKSTAVKVGGVSMS